MVMKLTPDDSKLWNGVSDPGSASTQWDGMVDANGDGIPDGAEITRTVSMARPDGASVQTRASWTKGARPMGIGGLTMAEQASQYGTAGSGVSANTYRAGMGLSGTTQQQARVRSSDAAIVQGRGMRIDGIEDAAANRDLQMALQESKNRTDMGVAQMKLKGDELQARTQEQVAKLTAQGEALRAVLAANPRPSWQQTNDGKAIFDPSAGPQSVTPIPQRQEPLEMKVDSNTGATVLVQGGRVVGTIQQPRQDPFAQDVTTAAQPATQKPPLKRKTPDGKIALFDADTKKFLGYEG